MNELAFIDEFGDNGLDFTKSGTSIHFIVSAVIVEEDKLKEIEAQVEGIRSKYFQLGEMKSKSVGINDDRRIKILHSLMEIDFHFFSIVVDKRRLKTKGFEYKQSFYKHLHTRLDSELFRLFPNIKIVADEHGHDKFKQEFIDYVKKRHVRDLFNQNFILSNSKSSPLIQLADIISGTLARCFEPSKISNEKDKFFSILKPKTLEIREWPYSYSEYRFDKNDFVEFNEVVAESGIRLATDFITKHEDSNSQILIDQISCLKYLVFYLQNIDSSKYVPTNILIDNINLYRTEKISMHYFRSKVIAKLRDYGLLISSSSKGYKIPINNKDLFDFVYHTNSYIEPMIDRLLKYRNIVKTITKNEVDIIDISTLKYISKLKDFN